MLQSLSPVSRMFNYLLCHVSTAGLRFFTPFLITFLLFDSFSSSGLKSAWPPFTFFLPMFLSCGCVTQCFWNQTDNPFSYKHCGKCSLKLQLSSLQLSRSSWGIDLQNPKRVKRSVLVSFHLSWQHLRCSVLQPQHHSQLRHWLLGLPLCLDSAPPTHIPQTSSLSSQNALGTRADL